MYLKVSWIEYRKNRFWKNDIFINRIWLYTDEWKYIRFIKLESELLLDFIKRQKIVISNDLDFNKNTNGN